MPKFMDPIEVWTLIAEHEDIITPEVKKDEEFFSNLACPVCSARKCTKKIKEVTTRLSPEGEPMLITPFTGTGVIQDGYGHCGECNTDFDPYTGLVFKTEASMIAEPG